MNFTDFHADMHDADYQKKPMWKPLYSARDAYGQLLRDRPLRTQDSLSPAFWHRVTEAFEESPEAFKDFLWRKTAGARLPKCRTQQCRWRWIESLRAARSEFNGQSRLSPLDTVHAPHKRQAAGDSFQEHELEDHEELPDMSSCSMHSHSVASMIRRLGEIENRDSLLEHQRALRTQHASSWIRGTGWFNS